MLGMQDMNADHMTKKLEDTLPVIQQVSEQFKNPVRITVCFNLKIVKFHINFS